MSIKSNNRREKDNEAKVVLKNLRISPQKLNLVLGMIRKQKADVAVSPGIAFGEYGEGFVRIGLVENEQRIRQAAKNVRNLKL